MTTSSAWRISPAVKRYWRRFAVLMTIYAVLLGGMIWVLNSGLVSGPLRYAIAVLPALPVAAVVWVVGLYLVEEKDEFARLFTVLSILWGLAAVLVATTIWGFAEAAGAPHLNPVYVFPIFGVSMTVSQP